MMEFFGIFFGNCAVPVLLILVGLIFGRTIEARHFRALKKREAKLLTIPLTDLKTPPPGVNGRGAVMVSGAVVIASDYLKTFLSSLRKIVGGELRSYERMMERARREAVCRLMTEAHRRGAVAVINLRLETSNIGGIRKNPAPMVEVLAYGTAVLPHAEGGQAVESPETCPRCGYRLVNLEVTGCPECGWFRSDAGSPGGKKR